MIRPQEGNLLGFFVLTDGSKRTVSNGRVHTGSARTARNWLKGRNSRQKETPQANPWGNFCFYLLAGSA